MEIFRLDHIMLSMHANEKEMARHFYGHILNFKELTLPDALIESNELWYEAANVVIHLSTDTASCDNINSNRHPAFLVRSIKDAKFHLSNNQIAFTEGQTKIPGESRISCRDPFGNRIEFIERGKA